MDGDGGINGWMDSSTLPAAGEEFSLSFIFCIASRAAELMVGS